MPPSKSSQGMGEWEAESVMGLMGVVALDPILPNQGNTCTDLAELTKNKQDFNNFREITLRANNLLTDYGILRDYFQLIRKYSPSHLPDYASSPVQGNVSSPLVATSQISSNDTSVSSPLTKKQVAIPGLFDVGQDLTKVEEVKPVDLRDLTAGAVPERNNKGQPARNIPDLASAGEGISDEMTYVDVSSPTGSHRRN